MFTQYDTFTTCYVKLQFDNFPRKKIKDIFIAIIVTRSLRHVIVKYFRNIMLTLYLQWLFNCEIRCRETSQVLEVTAKHKSRRINYICKAYGSFTKYNKTLRPSCLGLALPSSDQTA